MTDVCWHVCTMTQQLYTIMQAIAETAVERELTYIEIPAETFRHMLLLS